MLLSNCLALALLTVVSAIPVPKTPIAIDFTVVKETDFLKKHGYRPTQSLGHRKIAALNDAHSISIPNEGSYFLAALNIGSNDQEVGVIVDTGSSDLWFPSKSSCGNATATTPNNELSGLPAASSACPMGSFDESQSTTYNSMDKPFALYYGVEGYYTYAKGTWAKEDITWGGVVVNQLQFGLATDQDIGQGIIGISYNGTEGFRNKSDEYTNFPMALKEQGLVGKNAYSLYLNSTEADAGTILFGGIDEAKFEGELTLFDTVHVDDGGRTTDETVAFFVNLDGITQNNETLVSASHPGLLDSGSTLLYAPAEIYNSVAPKYGTYNTTAGGYITQCSTPGEDFHFRFGNLTIDVPFKQLLYNISDSDSLFTNDKGEEMCLFTLLSSSENVWILGDVFLRSAYIYYDLDDSKIGLAQAKYTDESRIISV